MRTAIKQSVLLGLMLIGSSCRSSGSMAANGADKICRQTIRKLYSLETYCPDNLMALQNLFTKEFNQRNKLTLERCNEISKYEVLGLFSEDDPGFLVASDDPKLSGTLEYLAKVSVTPKLEGRQATTATIRPISGSICEWMMPALVK